MSSVSDDLALLARVPLFAALPHDLLTGLAQAAVTVTVGGGQFLFRQGEQGEDLYVVRSGRLELLVDDEVVHVHGRGEFFGEPALLSGGVRTAAVRACRDSELLVLHRAEFDRLLATQPALAQALVHELGRRVGRDDAAMVPSPTSTVLALLPVQGLLPGSRVRDLADLVHAELARHTSVTRLEDDGNPDSWSKRLDAAEMSHSMVLLVAGRHDDAWWQFCARQADRPLVVVDPKLPHPATGLRRLAGCHLVALGATGLPHWIDLLMPVAHHVVEPDTRTEDVGRLARRVSGRAFGLVLSGGGARCFGHIGVVEVLRNAGVVIDRVGGTSMGAFMAGLVALGVDAGEMLDIAKRELVDRRPPSDYTVSRYGLIRARRAEAMLERVFGDALIEEQRTDLFTVSVDLVGAREVVHRRGRIADAVGLSSRLPGVAPPVWKDGSLHIDGGVLDNLPVEVMVADQQGPVVAVDVMRPFRTETEPRGAGRVPHAVDTIVRSMLLASWQRAEVGRALAHTLITPTLEDVGMFDFRRIDEIVDAGRLAAEEALPLLSGPVND